MQSRLNWLLFFALATCSLILILSIYPGVLQSWKILIAIALIGFFFLLAIAFIFLEFIACTFQNPQSPPDIHLRENFSKDFLIRIGLIIAIFICSYGLLKFYVPRRLAFSFSRPAFERWLTENSPKNTHPHPQNAPRPLNIKLGIYEVYGYAIDPRGGQYFRVHSHGDGLGPDTVSYGFVYQPNREGSPFGDAYYGSYPLGNGWYWFQASNDW